MATIYPPYLYPLSISIPPELQPYDAPTGYRAEDIRTRLVRYLQADNDLMGLLPNGSTIDSVVGRGANGEYPSLALEVAGEQWKPHTLGGRTVGSSDLSVTLGAVVQVRLHDRYGTATTQKTQAVQIETQYRRSLEKLRVDPGTPRLWTDLKPARSTFQTTEGIRYATLFVDVTSTPQRTP